MQSHFFKSQFALITSFAEWLHAWTPKEDSAWLGPKRRLCLLGHPKKTMLAGTGLQWSLGLL